MKWLDCRLKMVSNFGQFGSRIGHNVIQQRNNHVIQNFLVDTSIDFDPWPDFQIHHFNLAPVYFLSCFNKFLGLDLYLQINQNQNCVREKNQWVKNVTRLKQLQVSLYNYLDNLGNSNYVHYYEDCKYGWNFFCQEEEVNGIFSLYVC